MFISAEDAFQATFMVLVRKAATLRKRALLGNWLFGVAQRVALKARAKAAAIHSRQRELTDMPRPEPLDDVTWQELRPMLDEEIGRLPEKYRAPIVLCYLQGKSHEQAALELGWPRRSLSSRLTHARDLLRRNLTSRGIALSAGALTVALTEKTAPTAVGAMLAVNTAKAAASLAAGKAVAATVLSAEAIALADEIVKGMVAMKAKLLVFVLACSLTAGGTGIAAYQSVGGRGSGDATLLSKPDWQPGVIRVQPQNNVAEQQKADKPDTIDAKKTDTPRDIELPPGAIGRVGTVRWRHGGIVEFAAFLPDGKTVLTSSADQTVRLWEFPSGKEIRRLAEIPRNKANVRGGGFGGVYATAPATALSKDGKTVATAVGNSDAPDRFVRLFDVATGNELQSLNRDGKEVGAGKQYYMISAMVFSPDGKQLATLDTGGIIQIWDWVSAREILHLPANPEVGIRIAALAYSPDGKSIATLERVGRPKAIYKGALKLWDSATGELLRTSPAQEEISGSSLTFSPDSKMVVFSTDEGVICLVEAATGKIQRKLGERQSSAKALAFGKDGTKLYALEFLSKGIEEWDVGPGKLVREPQGPPDPKMVSFSRSAEAHCLSLCPDGKTVMISGLGNAPVFLDLASDKEMAGPPGHVVPALSVDFTAEGHLITSFNFAGALQQKQDMATGIAFPNFACVQKSDPAGNEGDRRFFKDTTTVFAVSRDAQVIAMRPQSKQKDFKAIDLVETFSGKLLCALTLKAQEKNLAVVFSPDGKALAMRESNQQLIELYEVPTGKLLHKFDINTGFKAAKVSAQGSNSSPFVIFSPDGKVLATYLLGGMVAFWDTGTGLRIGSLPLPTGISTQHAAMSPDGRGLALEMTDGSLKLYELATGEARQTFGEQQKAKKAKKTVQSMPGDGKTGAKFAFSPDGSYVVQAGWSDNNVHLWDVQTGQKLAVFKGHAGALNAVAFSPNGKTVASASADTTVLIWDAKQMDRRTRPAKALDRAELDASWVALAGTDAVKGFAAICSLAAAPEDAVGYLKEKLVPVPVVEIKLIQELVDQVGDEQFKVREKAISELTKIGDQIVPTLDRALAANLPLENKRRLEDLRGKFTGMLLQGQRLQAFRAVEVLELIGTHQSRQVLEFLAKGAACGPAHHQRKGRFETLVTLSGDVCGFPGALVPACARDQPTAEQLPPDAWWRCFRDTACPLQKQKGRAVLVAGTATSDGEAKGRIAANRGNGSSAQQGPILPSTL